MRSTWRACILDNFIGFQLLLLIGNTKKSLSYSFEIKFCPNAGLIRTHTIFTQDYFVQYAKFIEISL